MTEKKQTARTQGFPNRVSRSTTDKWIAGVCGGIAAHFGWDAAVVRIVWAVAFLVGGTGAVAYVLAWAIIPKSETATGEQEMTEKVNSNLIWGGLFILVGVLFLVSRFHWFGGFPFYHGWGGYPTWNIRLRLDSLLPLALILFGVYYLVNLRKPSGGQTTATQTKSTGEKNMEKKFVRSLDERMIGGVCGGISKYFNIDPSFVRIGYVLLSLAGGGFIGLIAYIAMMVIVPEESGSATADTPATDLSEKSAAKAAPKSPSKTAAAAKKTSRAKGKSATEKGK